MPEISERMSYINRQVFERTANKISILRSEFNDPDIKALATEVVSRLARRTTTGSLEFPISAERTEDFCTALVSDDPEAGLHIIQEALHDGASIEEIYLGHLARAARRLGEWWDEDTVPFAMVTIGAVRILGIMRSIRHLFEESASNSELHALFASVPGETHILGVSMAADLFKANGWHIELATGFSHDQIIEEFERSNSPIVGLSASSTKSIEALAKLVVALHMSNPAAFVMVSGQIVNLRPDIADLIDADFAAADVDSALEVMKSVSDRIMARGARHP